MLPAVEIPAIVAVQLGLPGRYVQGYGDSAAPYTYSDFSLFAQDDWRITPRLTAKLGVRYQVQSWPTISYNVTGYPNQYTFPGDGNNVAPRLGLVWDPVGDRKTTIHGAYGLYYDNLITGIAGITKGINGRDRVRTLVAGLPTTIGAWNAPGRKFPEPATAYPSLVISIDPALETPYAHHASTGVQFELPGRIALATDFIYVRGFEQPSTLDYNPLVPSLGANRRPSDLNGVAGTSASVLQYTSFGETWYRGVSVAATRRFLNRHQLMMNYTLSKADDNGTDFQSEFIAQDSGRGRNPDDPTDCRSDSTPIPKRGPRFRISAIASSRAARTSCRRMSSCRRLSRLDRAGLYNILAGVDLNADGDGGATDRARATLASIATSDAAQRRHVTRAGDRGSAAGAAIPGGSHELRRDLRGLQPLRSIELHGGEQHLRHWRVSDNAPADLRPVHAGCAAAPGAAGNQDRVLGSGFCGSGVPVLCSGFSRTEPQHPAPQNSEPINPPARVECRSASARPSSSSPSSRGRARGTC